ncbi:START domain-containing protein 10-like isoform X1 [Diorhabda carinulata]|uniref:START domain-containing protein 10-like isoform X1 n=2 Tax=Diorhabda carinulata TaxID=1163345 RepID=UPI0025A182C9|nr:START domain-containing protein 10-like isoform X1 [Diorhabda carinulata]XP_057667301.1 START domain-containing protein 10-like isoform X1 [Diorhabda carinulata]
MEPGIVKIADDSDFDMLKTLVDDDTDWKLEYHKVNETKVWTKTTPNTSFKMVKVQTVFQDISANTLFDVLHDPGYRKEWDEHMQASVEIGYLNPNNDVGYYALSCPAPVKNRDFVLQRSWLDMGSEKLILNHSVQHKDYANRKGYIRAISHLTGFVIRDGSNGCFLGYVSQTDPRGKLPPWLVNKITQKFAPKVVKQLKKAAEGYELWKSSQENPGYKPWVYPEQTLDSPRISISDCLDIGVPVEHSGDGEEEETESN